MISHCTNSLEKWLILTNKEEKTQGKHGNVINRTSIVLCLVAKQCFFQTQTVAWLMFLSNDSEMLPEEIHQSRSPSSSSPASSSSCAVVWIPGSSPPAQMWGRSLVAASAITQTLIYVLYYVPLNNWTFIGKYYFSTTVTNHMINTVCAFIVYCKS